MKALLLLVLLTSLTVGRIYAQGMTLESAGLEVGNEYSGATLSGAGIVKDDQGTMLIGGTSGNPFSLTGVMELNSATAGTLTLSPGSTVTDAAGNPPTFDLNNVTIDTGTLTLSGYDMVLTPTTTPGTYQLVLNAPEPPAWLLLAGAVIILAFTVRPRPKSAV